MFLLFGECNYVLLGDYVCTYWYVASDVHHGSYIAPVVHVFARVANDLKLEQKRLPVWPAFMAWLQLHGMTSEFMARLQMTEASVCRRTC